MKFAKDNLREKRRKTAMRRHSLSRPVQLIIRDQLLTSEQSFFDYGCGRGDDVRLLNKEGITSVGWDPAYFPDYPLKDAEVVNLGYVVNVIESLVERRSALINAWKLTKKVLIVSARLTREIRNTSADQFADGCVTKIGTFQKFFDHMELRNWIDQTLGASCVPVEPGIFYVFREREIRETYLSNRIRRRAGTARLSLSAQLFQENAELFQPLTDFFLDRGRLPSDQEIEGVHEMIDKFGSIRKAFSIVRRVTGPEEWDRARRKASTELLIYLALARFSGRPRFSELAKVMQLDVRALFSNYKKACKLADQLLHSIGDQTSLAVEADQSKIGKRTRSALYVHESAVTKLNPLLRLYEGCASEFLGSIEGANIIKLDMTKPKVSYLTYRNFDKDPHPALETSTSVNLQTFKIVDRDYRASNNRPILHRKELFVSEDYQFVDRFKRLTKSEEKNGLLSTSARIGTEQEWQEVLNTLGFEFRGHRLVRSK